MGKQRASDRMKGPGAPKGSNDDGPSVFLAPHTDWTLMFSACTGIIVLLISLVPPILGARAYTGERPSGTLLLQPFDIVFRAIGTAFPFIPMGFRVGASGLSTQSADTFGVSNLTMFQLHACGQLLRMFLYSLHRTGESMGIWLKLMSNKRDHVMADHVLLGVAVLASLAVELALSMYNALNLMGPKGNVTTGRAKALYCSALASSIFLVVLTSGDMYNTGRYFHEPFETAAALAFGFVFVFGACFLLFRISKRKSFQVVRRARTKM
jgi:hypothetical protein